MVKYHGTEKIMMEKTYYSYETAFGELIIESDGNSITSIKTGNRKTSAGKGVADHPTDKAAKQLDEYFAGKRACFDVPLNPHGTAFQRVVWQALCYIPYGETRSYKQIAQIIGNPNACRAVGMANNKNPVWIMIPCHRVIGANGNLTGYGGGLEMKQKLLELEKKMRSK